MNKTAAIAAVLAATTDQPVIFTTGFACRIARHLAERPNHFYMTGSMGLASSIGIGIALAARQPTVVVDGDGSLLMNPVGLLTAGGLQDLPLVHVVLDDASYASTGGQHAPPTGTNLVRLATAFGYPWAGSADRLDAFAELVRTAVADCASPMIVVAVLTEPDEPVPPRVDVDLGVHAREFRDHLAFIQQRAWPAREGSRA